MDDASCESTQRLASFGVMTSRAERRRMAASVAYEVWMMEATAERLRGLRTATEEERDSDWRVEANAFLESFLVHYRNVMDFLSPPDSARETKDVTCGALLGRPFDYRLPDTPTKYRNNINTFLAHVSKGREDGSVGWPTDDMMFEMDGAFVRFLDELSETDRDLFLDHDYSDPLALPPEVFSSGW